MQVQYGGQTEHKIFCRKYSTIYISTKWTFNKMTLRQKAFSTKWFSRRSVVRRSVVHPILRITWSMTIEMDELIRAATRRGGLFMTDLHIDEAELVINF